MRTAKTAPDLTAAEAVREAVAFAAIIGPEAVVIPTLNWEMCGETESPLRMAVYRDRFMRQHLFTVGADTWAGLFEGARSRWAEVADEHERRTVREMALEIIRLTAEHGVCTDAALRGAKFGHSEVARLGAKACAEATAMAANGPFTIVAAALSNFAPAEAA